MERERDERWNDKERNGKCRMKEREREKGNIE